MVTAVESSYDRTVRVLAPRARIYDELGTAEGMIRYMPQIERFQLLPEPDRVLIHTSVSVGPLQWHVEALLRVDRLDPPSVLGVNMTIPGLQLEVDGAIELIESAVEETQLTYRATIGSRHRLMRRLRSSLTGSLEEHIDTTTDRIATLARQHAEAERRLTGLDQGQGQN